MMNAAGLAHGSTVLNQALIESSVRATLKGIHSDSLLAREQVEVGETGCHCRQ